MQFAADDQIGFFIHNKLNRAALLAQVWNGLGRIMTVLRPHGWFAPFAGVEGSPGIGVDGLLIKYQPARHREGAEQGCPEDHL